MSSIASVGAGSEAHVKPISRASLATPSTKPSPLAAAQQEATETLDVTRREAASGDQVALRKLAALERGHEARQAPSSSDKNDHGHEDNGSSQVVKATTPQIVAGGLDTQA